MPEWGTSAIGDHVELATGPAFKSKFFRDAPPGIRLARGDAITEGRFRWATKSKYWPELTPKLERYLLEEGDVLIGMDGSKVGRNWTVVRRSDLPCLLVQRVARLRAKGTLDPRMLPYFIGSRRFREYVDRVKTGSAIHHISGGQIRAYEIPLPPLSEQHRIAAILGALDDKIELNRRMNRTLEEIAQAVFKSWFIDFDGHADLVESELGMIPAGWAVRRIDSVADRIAMGPFGSRLKTESHRARGVPVIRGKNLAAGLVEDGFVYVDQEKAEELSNSIAYRGDIVFTHRGTLGQMARIPGSSLYDRYVVSQSQMLLRPNDEVVDGLWLEHWFRAVGMRELLTFTSATGVPAIGRPSTSLKSLELALPPRSFVADFAACASPLHERRDLAISESRTLAQLRDILLPKLISGEIRVPEGETLIEDAT
jgi:type I restriction enzyme, S subunit